MKLSLLQRLLATCLIVAFGGLISTLEAAPVFDGANQRETGTPAKIEVKRESAAIVLAPGADVNESIVVEPGNKPEVKRAEPARRMESLIFILHILRGAQ